MSWTKQTKNTDSTYGWGDNPFGITAWGDPSGSSWVKQSDASDSWTTVEDAD